MRFAAALLLALPAGAAHAEVLVYQGANKWVAPEHNAPLRALVAKAKAGQSSFSVVLPAGDRALAVTRLEIVSDILDKANPRGGVVLTEAASGTAAANTLEIVAE